MSDLTTGERVEQGNLGGTNGPVVGSATASGAVGAETQLIQFSGDEDDPQVLTISIAALGQTALRGPFTALIDFASGHGDQQRIEVDIPTNQVNTSNLTPYVFGGGLVVSVVASSVRVSIRNDASYAPSADGALNPVSAAGVQFTASIGTGGHPSSSPANRTIWGQWTTIGAGIGPAGVADVAIPVFARTFRVCRFDAAQTVTVSQLDAQGIVCDGPYNIAANDPGPKFEIVQTAEKVRITNTGAGVIKRAGCVFQLGGI